jgi:hypothetical protein
MGAIAPLGFAGDPDAAPGASFEQGVDAVSCG